MDDKTFDDSIAKQWIEGIEAVKATLRDQDIYPAVNAWIKKNNLKNILDVGCGQGICSEKIDLEGRSYIGVEPSRLMAERANELYQGVNRHFIRGNIYDLPVTDQSFDGIFSILVWHLLSDLDTAASELSRVLASGGKFLIITANPEAYKTWKTFYKEFKLDGKRLYGTLELSDGTKSTDTLFLHTSDEILESFQKVSLRIAGMETFRPSADGENIFISFAGSKAK